MSNTLLRFLAVPALTCAACSTNSLTQHEIGTDAPTASPDAGAPVDVTPPPFGTATLALVGDVTQVHDPAIIAVNGTYYVFSTGDNIPVRTSTDLIHWRDIGTVFTGKPAWVTTTDPSDPTDLWAPDISFFGGQFHLYYAASSFGSDDSCIGHATSPSLDTPVWTDHGSVICSPSSNAASAWNAIDPAAIVDQSGNIWLALGSFWSGLKLIALDSNGARLGNTFIALATRANTAVEASYLIHHGDFYYLFESVDSCCTSPFNYKIMVGRSADITGPYVDAQGTPLTSDGGTLIVQGDAQWIAPGHNAILHTDAGDYNVYHALDANAGNTPYLRISQMSWTSDGWPTSAGP